MSDRGARRVARGLASLLLGLQAFVWGGGPIVEARPAAEGLTAGAHIEAVGGTNCPWIHSHLDCLICRAFSGGAIGGSGPTAPVVAATVTWLPPAEVPAPIESGLFGPFGARAPPSA
ncbi:MAG TPA: hypothetical protein VF981_04525 [Gemmatimonadaceae bacterium]|jgi:hypothetical protein